MDDGGWSASAAAWIARMGEEGDAGRRFVLDPAMLARIEAGRYRKALDVGCGEGRFCRILKSQGIDAAGIDPTHALIKQARERDPDGDYRIGFAERLPFADCAFDLVISCLVLLDIADFRAAIWEMTRILTPGGALLVANLTPHQSAGQPGWQYDEAGKPTHFGMDNYGKEWASWVEWEGIRVQNWHRPLSAYMKAFLDAGLTLSFFDEPPVIGGEPDLHDRYTRAPFFNLMEWKRQVPGDQGST